MSDQEQPSSEPEPASAVRSLYDRMRGTRDRYDKLAKDFATLRNWVAPGGSAPDPSMFEQVRHKTFLEGMHLTLDDLDRIAGDIERRLKELAALFGLARR
jgi:hypothetical protein